jgi:hypothetical protein
MAARRVFYGSAGVALVALAAWGAVGCVALRDPNARAPFDDAALDATDDAVTDARVDAGPEAAVDVGADARTDAPACAAGRILCDGRCVDPADPEHCGACDTRCTADTRCAADDAGVRRCAPSACAAGFGDCDGDAANGCEVSLATSAAHCGACGRPCAPANATGGCSGGRCLVTACAEGFADCDGDASNGCEVDLQRDPVHCGACGTRCAAANATLACTAGACTLTACADGFADCNGSPADGCEVDTRVNAAHCGACRRACTLNNAATVCMEGVCRLAACNANYGDCDGDPSNGCEVLLTSNVAHCGACRRACAAGQGCSSSNCLCSSEPHALRGRRVRAAHHQRRPLRGLRRGLPHGRQRQPRVRVGPLRAAVQRRIPAPGRRVRRVRRGGAARVHERGDLRRGAHQLRRGVPRHALRRGPLRPLRHGLRGRAQLQRGGLLRRGAAQLRRHLPRPAGRRRPLRRMRHELHEPAALRDGRLRGLRRDGRSLLRAEPCVRDGAHLHERRMPLRRRCGAGLAVALLVWPAALGAQPRTRGGCRDAGRRLETALELRERALEVAALEVLTDLYAECPSPRVEAQMGLAAQGLRRWVDARTHLRGALGATEDAWVRRVRAQLEAALGLVEAELGWVAPTSATAGTEMYLDGRAVGTLPLAEAMPVAPGRHTAEFRAPGHLPVSRAFEVAAQARWTPSIELPPEAPDGARGGARGGGPDGAAYAVVDRATGGGREPRGRGAGARRGGPGAVARRGGAGRREPVCVPRAFGRVWRVVALSGHGQSHQRPGRRGRVRPRGDERSPRRGAGAGPVRRQRVAAGSAVGVWPRGPRADERRGGAHLHAMGRRRRGPRRGAAGRGRMAPGGARGTGDRAMDLLSPSV